MLEGLFREVLVVSGTVGVVLLLLLLLAKPLRRRYASKGLFVVWLVLFARLVLPFNLSLPDAPVQLQDTRALAAVAREYVPEQIGTAAQNPQGEWQEDRQLAGEMIPEYKQALNWAGAWQALSWLWLGGAAALALWHIGAGLRLKRYLRKNARPVEDEAALALLAALCGELSLKKQPRLYTCAGVGGPALTGLLRPVVLLGDELPGAAELPLVLRHELCHLKRRDVWAKLLLLAAKTLHWFNPLVWLGAREAAREMELACDAACTKGLEQQKKAEYGQLILDSIRQDASRAGELSTALGSSAGFVRRRLDNLFRGGAGRRAALVLAVCVLGVSVLGACVAAGGNGDSSLPAGSGISTPAEDVQYITTEEELRAIGVSEEGLRGSYVQTEDIVLTQPWVPIGTEEQPFTGTFDGGGHTIEGLYIDDPDMPQPGMFGVAQGAELKGIRLVNAANAPGIVDEVDIVGVANDCVLLDSYHIFSSANTERGYIALEPGELRFYTEGDKHPYLRYTFVNHTSKAIVEYETATLVYDADGQPLDLDWYSFSASASRTNVSYLNEHVVVEYTRIEPGEGNGGENGGWSVFDRWNGEGDSDIAYVLHTLKWVEFEDGFRWENPDYESWVETYEGKPIDPQVAGQTVNLYMGWVKQ